MRRIPSTQALRALESFARHGSVWRAAEELNLTRSAISHQLRLLERELGFSLFNRVGTKIELTPQGLAYAADIRHALVTIAGSAARHANRGATGNVRISCTAGFASNWLCNRINEFNGSYPGVMLDISTPRRLDDVNNPDIDIFIAFGNGNWKNMVVERLVEVEFTPLCSPRLINRIGVLSSPEDIDKACLLHLGDREDWRRWAVDAGLDVAIASGGVVFSDMNLVYSAAVGGQGIAMGDEFICRTSMDNGDLVRPFDRAIPSTNSYYLVVSEEKARPC